LAASKFKEKVNKVKVNDGGWSVDRYKQEIKDEKGNVVDTVPLIVETPKKRKREDGSRFKEGEIVKINTDIAPSYAKAYRLTKAAIITLGAVGWVSRAEVLSKVRESEDLGSWGDQDFQAATKDMGRKSHLHEKVHECTGKGLYMTKVAGEWKMKYVV
jgi:hypothetical protein